MSMDTRYQPEHIEQRWYQHWESQGLFAPPTEGEPYCIMLPPPNVTGTLHMGHAFQATLMDILIRSQRMQGKASMWQAGTDHAGIATQMVVERQLQQQGKSRHELGRAAFTDAVWQWKESSGSQITQQLRRLGASLDWQHERFTMDDALNTAVNRVFVALHQEGLIYRGKRLVNWDPVLKTAISDLEVKAELETGSMWHFRYPLADGSGQLEIATTRPETLLGDSAVAVHPEDERYQHLIGQQVSLPLCDRTIPIIADSYVDPDFGTGCVKITPAHDFNDYEVGQRHQLPLLNILDAEACINDNAPAAFRGMSREDARHAVVATMEQLDLLVRVEPHELAVPRGDRSGSVIEPWLTDQWYVRTESLAREAIRVVEDGQIRFVPENWRNTYYEWMHNIQDWCISRQLWWGHRIPAWYDDQGDAYVAHSEAEAQQQATAKHGKPVPLHQDEDVLDTWFSSALWPFSTLGWPEDSQRLQRFYPTQVLVTGFDIIFFWVARMIMMGLKFTGQVPFKEVYIHGLVRDAHGQKMSKSKGNVLDPIDLIDGIELEPLVKKRTQSLMQPAMRAAIEQDTRTQYPDGIPAFGTDAMRFTFAAMASTGRDINFDIQRINGYRNFCNKLWNASRFVCLQAEGHTSISARPADQHTIDRWIRSRLSHTASEMQRHLRQYRFDLMAQTYYDFVWNTFCDWYLELSKPVLQHSTAPQQAATRDTLNQTLADLLLLGHPIIPFITEELWQRVAPLAGRSSEVLLHQRWPEPDAHDPEAEASIQWLQGIVMGIRKLRSGKQIAPGKRIDLLLIPAHADDTTRVEEHQALLHAIGRLDSLQLLPQDSTPPAGCAIELVGQIRLCLSLDGLIDKEAELKRLHKQLGQLEQQQKRLSGKLNNSGFLAKAPAAVVDKERQKLSEAEASLTALHAELSRLQAL